MPTLVAAATHFEQLFTLLTGDALLSTLLPGGWYPRVEDDNPEGSPDTEAGRFGLLKEIADTTAVGGPITMQAEVHEPDKGQGRWDAKRAIERVEWLIDLVKFEQPTGSIRVPIRAYWQATSGFVADEGWQTQKYVGTFIIGGH